MNTLPLFFSWENRMKQTHCKRGHEKTPENTSRAGSCKTCMRQWRQAHPEACRHIAKNSARKSRMRNLYHITEEEYAEMYAKQNGLCALPSCGQPATDIDHSHELNRTRGLMCNKHNLALGLFMDNPVLLREAAEYLENFHG